MLRPGDAIDIWVVEKALGSGGMGSVYRCHNRSAPRILAAVKVLDSALRRFPEAEARFVREAEILFQLDHPNIVKVRNIRTDTDPPYLEMEFIDGESLEERLARGPIPIEEALPLMQQVADAVRQMHAQGIRHRDIKPANLLVQPDGRAKLVDFGLAVEEEVTRITAHGMAFGTVSYAPPEWITPEKIDPELWDIYALGTIFYEMLTGLVAFPTSGEGSARQQAMQVVVAKQRHAPLDPGDAFHDDIRSLIGAMTDADPGRRLPRAALAVERLAAVSPSMVRPLDPRPATEKVSSKTERHAPRTFAAAMGNSTLSGPVRTMIVAGFGLFLVGGITLLSALGVGVQWLATAEREPEPKLAAAGPPALTATPIPPAPAPLPAIAPPAIAPVPAPDPAPAGPPAEPAPATAAPPKKKDRPLVSWGAFGPWAEAQPHLVGKIGVKGDAVPVSGVSALDAQAYCESRGGTLLGEQAPPDMPADPDMEFRRKDNGEYVLVENNNGERRLVPVKSNERNSVAGFRCTK